MEIYIQDKRIWRSDDGICELPDEILDDVLSRLPMREAARTSVLSRRWKHTWTYTTAGFDFDFDFDFENGRAGYINNVNKILNAHNGSTIKEFRVKFYLNATHRSNIDTWIDFALHKRVEELELQLSHSFPPGINFPLDVHDLYSFKLNTDMDLTFLTSLKLNNVNVTDDVIEHILANCTSLEELSVRHSPSLIGVRVVVPIPKLNNLDISYCDSFKYLHIYSAPNLELVTYNGPENSSLSFTNVPNLSYMLFWANYSASLVSRFGQLPLHLENLLLALEVAFLRPRYNLPQLNNVKHLELVLGADYSYSLVLPCSSILEACPNLQKLSLKFVLLVMSAWEYDGQEEVEQLENCSVHKNLKEIDLTYFAGLETEKEVVEYLLSTAPFLKRIVFNSILTRVLSQYSKNLADQLVPAAEVLLDY